VQPPFADETDVSGEVQDPLYICAFLGNLHLFVFMYNCFKTVHKALHECESKIDMWQVLSQTTTANLPVQSNDHGALRAWMGYSTPTAQPILGTQDRLDTILGPAHNRFTMIAYARKKLQVQWGKDFEFTKEQVRLLQTMTGEFVMIRCCAGAGKTTILLCICLWILKLHSEGARICIHYMSETQELVTDFLSLLRRMQGNDIGICPLGFHAESYVDRLDRDLRSKLAARAPKIFEDIEILETCLAYMTAMHEAVKTATPEEIEAYVCICRILCTLHHVRLHRSYYKQLREQQIGILQDMCVLGSTVAYAHKLCGQGSGWSHSVQALNAVIAVLDEAQGIGRLEVAAASAPYSTCVAVGDGNQDCFAGTADTGGGDKKPITSITASLRDRDILAWAARNKKVQTLYNNESLRYGEPLLGHLQTLFSFMEPVTTKQKQRTSLLPLFFEFKQELAQKTATGEISREASIFSVLLVLVALEVVLAGKTNGRRVLVVCYLTSVGADLKSYFQWGLSEMCWRWHHAFQLGYALETKYSFDHLVRDEVLTLAGPVRCRGMTADVFFCSV